MLRNGGERDYDALGATYNHPIISPSLWNHHGFTVCKEMDLHTVTKAKVDELAGRTIDPLAIPCIIPIQGNENLNSEMWQDLSAVLKINQLHLLMDDLRFKQLMETSKEYITATSKEKADMLLPYIQTLNLRNEAVNLKSTWRSGVLKLSEPSNGYKDRIVALSYGNYIASKIINKHERLNADGAEIDWNSFQLVY